MAETPEYKSGEIIFYSTFQGKMRLEVFFQEETFWLSQKKLGELFGVDVRTISEHLRNIYNSNELEERATIRKFRIVQTEGSLTKIYEEKIKQVIDKVWEEKR